MGIEIFHRQPSDLILHRISHIMHCALDGIGQQEHTNDLGCHLYNIDSRKYCKDSHDHIKPDSRAGYFPCDLCRVFGQPGSDHSLDPWCRGHGGHA